MKRTATILTLIGVFLLLTTTSVTSDTPGFVSGAGCDAIPDQRIQTDVQTSRTAPQPGSCVAAVNPVTWGNVKAVYE
jgi:hypothetical protein